MDRFPEDVRQFLNLAISSVYQLGTLLLLRASPEREWRAAEVGQAIYTEAGAVGEKLTEPMSHRLVRSNDDPGGRYYFGADRPGLPAWSTGWPKSTRSAGSP